MNWVLLKNSLLVSGGATLLALGLGFAAALFATALPTRLSKAFVSAAIMGLALPPFLIANCWLDLLGGTGVWRGWIPLNLFSLGGTIWLLALWLWPVSFLGISSAWRRLGPELLETDLAIRGRHLVWIILVPLARTSLLQVALITFVLALNNFTIPAILQVKVLPAEVWSQFSTNFKSLEALFAGWPMLVLPLVLLAWLRRQEIVWPYGGRRLPGRLLRRQLGPAWFFGAGFVTLIVCSLSPGLPLFQLLMVKESWLELPGAVAAGKLAIWNSLFFGASSAMVVTALGLLAACVWSRRSANQLRLRGGREGSLVEIVIPDWAGMCLWVPFLVPGVFLGIVLVTMFNRPWTSLIYQGPAIVLIALVTRYLAFGWTPIRQGFQSANPNLLDAARLEGASAWQIFQHVYWPHVRPRVVGVWYVVFLLCLWDVESIILIVPPGGETLALRIFNFLHYGHNPQVNALCIALLGLALIPVVLFGIRRFALRATRLSALCGSLLVLASCARTGSEESLHSQLFSAVEVIGARGVGAGQLNKPRSLAVDRNDNLYVVDMTGRVQKFSPAGEFQLSWQLPQTDKGRPKGMCCDRDGNIIVNEPHYSRVNHYDTSGKLVAQWGQHGTNGGELAFPRAVAVNSRDELFLSEYGLTERVQCFQVQRGSGGTIEPRFLHAFGRMGSGPGEFNRPEGLCVDRENRLYVADSCNHRIQVFDASGHFLRSYGKPGTGKGELSYPYDICVDSGGRQYVCEFGNSRIQVFDTNGRSIEIIGGPGAAPGRFANPWGVTLDSKENLYVADSQNHRIQKFVRRPPVGFRTSSSGPAPAGSDAVFRTSEFGFQIRSAGVCDSTTRSSNEKASRPGGLDPSSVSRCCDWSTGHSRAPIYIARFGCQISVSPLAPLLPPS